jgi:hypothetical protein
MGRFDVDLPNNLQGYVPIVSARPSAVIYNSELLHSILYTKIGYGYVHHLTNT